MRSQQAERSNQHDLCSNWLELPSFETIRLPVADDMWDDEQPSLLYLRP